MGIFRIEFFKKRYAYDEVSKIQKSAFAKLQSFINEEENIKVINIEHNHYGNGEEFVLYYLRE